MLTNPQKSMLKRAQRQANLHDAEYREALSLIAGVNSSTDPHLGDNNLDQLMAYFEAIYWHKVDAGEVQPSHHHNAVFRERKFWAKRNTSDSTSRDRYTAAQLQHDIHAAEAQMYALGFGFQYLAKIQNRTRSLRHYLVALHKTIESKRRQNAPTKPDVEPVDCPF